MAMCINRHPNPTLAILLALGYQGGTIHQVAKMTGLTVSTVLELKPDYTSAAAIQGYADAEDVLVLRQYTNQHSTYHGVVDYWRGVLAYSLQKNDSAYIAFYTVDPETTRANPVKTSTAPLQSAMEIVAMHSDQFCTVHKLLAGDLLMIHKP